MILGSELRPPPLVPSVHWCGFGNPRSVLPHSEGQCRPRLSYSYKILMAYAIIICLYRQLNYLDRAEAYGFGWCPIAIAIHLSPLGSMYSCCPRNFMYVASRDSDCSVMTSFWSPWLDFPMLTISPAYSFLTHEMSSSFFAKSWMWCLSSWSNSRITYL